MSQWYLSYDGNKEGPFDQAQAIARTRKNSNGFVWREGFAEWMQISQIAELSGSDSSPLAPPPPKGSTADEIDFKVIGSEMQFVEIELDPGESAVAEAGAMIYKDASIQMSTVFGDGSQSSSDGGFMDKLLGAGKRLLTGESLFMTVFIHAGGTVVERELKPGEVLHVDTGCIVAMEKTIQFDIQQAGNIKSAFFGGEGLFFATLSGPGRIWLQSLPFSRLAGRMLQASPGRGGGKGEGSILGTLGNIIDGD